MFWANSCAPEDELFPFLDFYEHHQELIFAQTILQANIQVALNVM